MISTFPFRVLPNALLPWLFNLATPTCILLKHLRLLIGSYRLCTHHLFTFSLLLRGLAATAAGCILQFRKEWNRADCLVAIGLDDGSKKMIVAITGTNIGTAMTT